jgi:hypothetical protein
MIERSHFAALLLSIFICTGSPAAAQEEFDLSIPGQEVEVKIPTPESSAPAEGTASTGEVKLLEMIKAGGWSMWVLGTFSFAVIGLMIFCLMDLQKKNFHPEAFVDSIGGDMDTADLDSVLKKAHPRPTALGK